MRHTLTAAALHVALIALIFCLCPVVTSGDSCWTVPVATNLIEHGSPTIDRFPSLPYANPGCVSERAPNGHLYAAYPIAVPVSAVPFLLPLRGVLWLTRQILHIKTANPILQEFFDGKLAGSAHAVAEMMIASGMMALAAGIQFLIARQFLSFRLSSFLTVLFAFATPVWSNASRAMWNQTPALLMFILAIYLLLLARRQPRYAAYASIPLEIAFMTRPGMIFPAALLTLFVLIHYRQQFPRYCALAIPLAAVFFAYNLQLTGHLFQRYFTDAGLWPSDTLPARFGLQLISPSRGLFIFCPLTLFSFAGMWFAWRSKWLTVAPWLAALVFVQILLVAKYFWPGFAYGPRYFTEIIPLFTLFLIPVLQRLTTAPPVWRILFGVACAWSFFVQFRGATDFAVHRWNDTPVSVDIAKYRVWDWHDPQFLRGL